MKRFFYCFILFVVFCYNHGFTSSKLNKQEQDWIEQQEPSYMVNNLFRKGLQREDFRLTHNISQASSIIKQMYPKSKVKQLKSIQVWKTNMQKQKNEGLYNYTEQDIIRLETEIKKMLEIK